MWGPNPGMGPMWGFCWVLAFVGLLICLLFVAAAVRAMSRGGKFVGGHRGDPEETAELRRQVKELRDEVNRLKAAR